MERQRKAKKEKVRYCFSVHDVPITNKGERTNFKFHLDLEVRQEETQINTGDLFYVGDETLPIKKITKIWRVDGKGFSLGFVDVDLCAWTEADVDTLEFSEEINEGWHVFLTENDKFIPRPDNRREETYLEGVNREIEYAITSIKKGEQA